MTAAAPEEALAFSCEGETLVGILHRPAPDAPPAHAGTGVVVIVGGPQYRAGSHRQFVDLARALAAAGHPVLRFDLRGMGDSTGALSDFERITPDIGAAIDALQRQAPAVCRVALWGLCDGASAALLYLDERRDPRVAGLCLVNPWVRSEATLARTHVKHYYVRRLREKEFWLKFFTGRVAGQALRGLLDNLRQARGSPVPDSADLRSFQARMGDAWTSFNGSVLLALSGDDYTAKEFIELVANDARWRTLLQRNDVERVDLPDADHTLSDSRCKAAVNAATVRWLSSFRAQRGEPTPLPG